MAPIEGPPFEAETTVPTLPLAVLLSVLVLAASAAGAQDRPRTLRIACPGDMIDYAVSSKLPDEWELAQTAMKASLTGAEIGEDKDGERLLVCRYGSLTVTALPPDRYRCRAAGGGFDCERSRRRFSGWSGDGDRLGETPRPEPAVPPPATTTTARAELALDGGLDLDAGADDPVSLDLRLAEGPRGDIVLIPTNGARLGLFGAGPIRSGDCGRITLDDERPIAVQSIPVGGYICVLTVEGRGLALRNAGFRDDGRGGAAVTFVYPARRR